jgi:hypothetical protein
MVRMREGRRWERKEAKAGLILYIRFVESVMA